MDKKSFNLLFLFLFFFVVLPIGEPVISGAKQFYQAGEILQANCTSNGSIPSALLEWKLNKFPVCFVNIFIKYFNLYYVGTSRYSLS